jgi:hypothetical protein
MGEVIESRKELESEEEENHEVQLLDLRGIRTLAWVAAGFL